MQDRSFPAFRRAFVWMGLSGLSVVALAGCPPDPMPAARECEQDSDCRDDSSFCNGPQVCVTQVLMTTRGPWTLASCQRGAPPCPSELCNEETDRCRCAQPDADDDGAKAVACGGDDCDDDNAFVFPGGAEVCDADDVDEDCEPETFGMRDVDGDHVVAASCCNGDICGTDCDDMQSGTHRFAVEVCDGVDNDCDGGIDEIVLVPSYTDADGDGWGTGAVQQRCAGVPGYASVAGDCDDAEPQLHPRAFRCVSGADIEICGDDGSWSDSSCPGLGLCVPQPDATGVCLPGEGLTTQCADGVDNDGDGLIDWSDPQCTSPLDNTELERTCADGIDNDTDGFVDYPNDPGCQSAEGSAETDPVAAPACSNGLDDDLDGTTDYAGGAGDPGCVAASDGSERQADGWTCDNGLDDNLDAKATIDYPADVVCPGPDSDAEHLPACSNALDDDFDGLIDFGNDLGCDTANDDGERAPSGSNYVCDNGLDDDGDGVSDYPGDPECISPVDSTEI